MQSEPTGKQITSTEVAPPVTPSSPWSVRSVRPLPNFQLAVTFADETAGIVDLAGLLASKTAAVFTTLADSAIFNQVHVELGAVTWPGELDLAPGAMYDDIKATGVCTITPPTTR